MASLKVPKIRDKKYRKWISCLPCIVCGRSDVQAAHIRNNNGGGMGMKPSDDQIIPLCLKCHVDLDQHKRKDYWDVRISKAKEVARELYGAYLGGVDPTEIVRRFRSS